MTVRLLLTVSACNVAVDRVHDTLESLDFPGRSDLCLVVVEVERLFQCFAPSADTFE